MCTYVCACQSAVCLHAINCVKFEKCISAFSQTKKCQTTATRKSHAFGTEIVHVKNVNCQKRNKKQRQSKLNSVIWLKFRLLKWIPAKIVTTTLKMCKYFFIKNSTTELHAFAVCVPVDRWDFMVNYVHCYRRGSRRHSFSPDKRNPRLKLFMSINKCAALQTDSMHWVIDFGLYILCAVVE